MSQLATIEQPGAPVPNQTSAKPDKQPAIPRKVRHGCELIASGECKTIKAAAERAGLSREHLSKMMSRPHVQAFIARKASENIQRGALRASARLVELIDAESEHVAARVSERIAEHNGILRPQTGSGTSVNVSINNNMSAGYVIDLSPHQPLGQEQRSPDKGTPAIEIAAQSDASTGHPPHDAAQQATYRVDKSLPAPSNINGLTPKARSRAMTGAGEGS